VSLFLLPPVDSPAVENTRSTGAEEPGIARMSLQQRKEADNYFLHPPKNLMPLNVLQFHEHFVSIALTPSLPEEQWQPYSIFFEPLF